MKAVVERYPTQLDTLETLDLVSSFIRPFFIKLGLAPPGLDPEDYSPKWISTVNRFKCLIFNINREGSNLQDLINTL